jgi:hypothetical protein
MVNLAIPLRPGLYTPRKAAPWRTLPSVSSFATNSMMVVSSGKPFPACGEARDTVKRAPPAKRPSRRANL